MTVEQRDSTAFWYAHDYSSCVLLCESDISLQLAITRSWKYGIPKDCGKTL